ncbi:O-phosphoseryl-tRNA(Cys) synthetase [Methanohalobium evestigatum Z-7303]|uniref:O-phosphoserine--tRNA(Cys) ligase n=1 Tax=Methanohalobium evestigatum (strain ATCC BAA-1072 / DSM 3721 / NBRC 107634 / OCM 161 / Z-7303) TaxID=644295 RepID=D7EB42_METEZ|nr:O-phosphoserine--tRNA ligase [Methanohalobium evestigatum]ADI74559.1 O-phosphoseryl-tRNA(Cys) synthetase [Methanohalobium evestigatum Z-7303]
MKFDPESFKQLAKEDFDAAWNSGNDVVKQPALNEQYPHISLKYGKPHPVYDTINKLREAYLRMGFDEMMNPLIVDEQEIHRQFGHEALTVLDRCFYLAGLARPNVGIPEERINSIKGILGDIGDEGIETIRKILHSYKKGDIEGDDLVIEISEQLGVSDTHVVEMIDKVFPEFKELVPQSTRKTLRSHMTSGWFISLSSLLEREYPPFHFFSIDRCFRREQQEDAARLMTYYSASCVIMAEDVSVDYGKAVAEGLLSQFGFEKFKFKPDEKRSKYYVPDTQIEVFAYHPKLVGSNTSYSDGWIEIATFGIYSPVALAQYDIPYPVMNLGMGVERLAMILNLAEDVRAMTYPQLTKYSNWVMKDRDLAKKVFVDKTPLTDEGRKICKNIVEQCELHGSEPSPCECFVWEGTIEGRYVKVWVVEPEEDTKLCGPAAFNEVVAYYNDILGIPNNKKWQKAFENDSARTGIRFIDAFASKAAFDIEEAVASGETETETRVRIVKVPSEINIKLDPLAQKYITGKNKNIEVRGPVFTTVRAKIE